MSYWHLIWVGMHDITMILLTFSAIISISLGVYTEGWETGWFDGSAIIAAILVCLNVSAINDLQKDKQFRILNAANNRMMVTTIRNGEKCLISTDDLVVGDIIQVSGGDTVPADCYYLNGSNVKMDESKLTGESDQVDKNEVKNPFLVSSTECHEGSCTALIVAVGQHSVFGHMRAMIESEGESYTPLQVKLAKLAKQLSLMGCFMGVITMIFIIAMHLWHFFSGEGTVDVNGNPYWDSSNWTALVDAFTTGVAIMVLAIPEGLPLAVTIALAYSVKRMMKDNNLVRHLNACETMGGANTICSDKTGTLTQNQMTVVQGWVYSKENETALLSALESGSTEEYNAFIAKCAEIGESAKQLLMDNALLNNESYITITDEGKERGVGSALDIALLRWARLLKVDYTQVREKYPLLNAESSANATGIVRRFPFHSNRKRASVLVRLADGKYRLYVKGAPEMVIRLCDAVLLPNGTTKQLTGTFQEDSNGNVTGSGSRCNLVKHCIYPMARQALRVLAFAYRDFDSIEDIDKTVQYPTEDQKGVGECPVMENFLTLVAFLGFQDPVRPEVPEAVLSCQKAGIFVRMVTGDNMETAKAIARQCNIYHHDTWKDPNGREWPAGRAILGSQFREIVGGLTLPPHFFHECHCKDCSNDEYFVPDYKTPDYPVHFGYPSIVGHKDHHCADWTEEAKKKRGSDAKSQCTEECKQRGCMCQVKNPKDERQLQQFYVVKNQGQFDQFVDTLQVMARSAPTDKHLLVTGLMERQQVVAVTGDGTNDGPALSKSNVGFAMGITGTSVAKDASDIVLMDDNFTSIVKAVMWGRNVYDSIRKFIQFQLTVNVGALLLAFVSACIINESPLKAVQLLWVNLIMDTFAALALATELPTEQLLERGPSRRDESLISSVMLRNILGQMLYQFTMLMFLVFQGYHYFNIPNGMDLGESASPTVHYTLVFNIFVMMQVFNEFNSRKINNECNVFSHIFDNYLFWVIIIGTIIVQMIIVEIGGEVMSTTTLSWSEIGISILLGALCLVYQQLIRTIPGSIFLDLNGDESNSVSSVWERFLRVDSSKWELPSVTTLTFSQKPAALRRIDTTAM